MHISRLQFKAEGPNFNAELIPVHSPLLRESCLVSYPPLTYMLKFSGFADLTSCQGNGRQGPREQARWPTQAKTPEQVRVQLVGCRQRPNELKASRAHMKHLGAQTRAANTSGSRQPQLGWAGRRQHETEVDTEAGMLSGVSRKRSIRSSPCWFTEFCKSQCLSHFAAPFIVV